MPLCDHTCTAVIHRESWQLHTVAWLPSKQTPLHWPTLRRTQQKYEWSSNTTSSLIYKSSRLLYQVYTLAVFLQIPLTVPLEIHQIFGSNPGDHLPPPLIPRNPCWHPNRKSPWPWTSQRVRRWWPSPPWHLGSFVPRGFSRDPYMVEMWRW